MTTTEFATKVNIKLILPHMAGSVLILGDNIMNPVEAQRHSNFIKHQIERLVPSPAWDDCASRTVYDLLASVDTRLLKRAALRIFQTSYDPAIEKLKTLVIYVKGYCPYCGEPINE